MHSVVGLGQRKHPVIRLPDSEAPPSLTKLHLFTCHGVVGKRAAGSARGLWAFPRMVLGGDFSTQSFQLTFICHLENKEKNVQNSS